MNAVERKITEHLHGGADYDVRALLREARDEIVNLDAAAELANGKAAATSADTVTIPADEYAALKKDAERLEYIERTFSGMTNCERYLPVQMIWGKGNCRTLREACDKYMRRDAFKKESERD